jgi:hypothetical protein
MNASTNQNPTTGCNKQTGQFGTYSPTGNWRRGVINRGT